MAEIKEIELNQKTLWRPPLELFPNTNLVNPIEKAAIEEPSMIFDRLEYTPEGRPLMWFKGFKYPRKGVLDPELTHNLNMAKRATRGYILTLANKYAVLPAIGFALTPWKYKVKMMERFLDGWCRQVEQQMEKWFMEADRYMLFSQELGWFVEVFLIELGFNEAIAGRTARAVKTLLESDSQYNMPLKDAFYQIQDKEELLNSPGKAIEMVADILTSRDKLEKPRFGNFGKIGKWLLRIPKLKRAFRVCVNDMNLNNLWPDEADFHFMCRQRDYDYDGMPIERRWAIFEKEYTNPETGEVTLPPLMRFVKK